MIGLLGFYKLVIQGDEYDEYSESGMESEIKINFELIFAVWISLSLTAKILMLSTTFVFWLNAVSVLAFIVMIVYIHTYDEPKEDKKKSELTAWEEILLSLWIIGWFVIDALGTLGLLAF